MHDTLLLSTAPSHPYPAAYTALTTLRVQRLKSDAQARQQENKMKQANPVVQLHRSSEVAARMRPVSMGQGASQGLYLQELLTA